jgi:hypothetical protein
VKPRLAVVGGWRCTIDLKLVATTTKESTTWVFGGVDEVWFSGRRSGTMWCGKVRPLVASFYGENLEKVMMWCLVTVRQVEASACARPQCDVASNRGRAWLGQVYSIQGYLHCEIVVRT